MISHLHKETTHIQIKPPQVSLQIYRLLFRKYFLQTWKSRVAPAFDKKEKCFQLKPQGTRQQMLHAVLWLTIIWSLYCACRRFHVQTTAATTVINDVQELEEEIKLRENDTFCVTENRSVKAEGFLFCIRRWLVLRVCSKTDESQIRFGLCLRRIPIKIPFLDHFTSTLHLPST